MADDPDPAAAQIRAVRPDDDPGALLELNERSFGPKSPDVRDQWWQAVSRVIEQGRCLGAFAGDRLVGVALYHDMRQWWCGRAVPMAGVASVAVAGPTQRLSRPADVERVAVSVRAAAEAVSVELGGMPGPPLRSGPSGR